MQNIHFAGLHLIAQSSLLCLKNVKEICYIVVPFSKF